MLQLKKDYKISNNSELGKDEELENLQLILIKIYTDFFFYI